MADKEQKIKELEALLGDEELTAEILSQSESTQKTAEGMGVKFKERVGDLIDKIKAKKEDVEEEEEEVPAEEPEAEVDAEAEAESDEDEDEDEDEKVSRKEFQAAFDGLNKRLDDFTDATKKAAKKEYEGEAAVQERLKELESNYQEAFQSVEKKLAELTGEMPAAAKGYTASADPDNLASDQRVKESMPQSDPLMDFMKNMNIGQ